MDISIHEVAAVLVLLLAVGLFLGFGVLHWNTTPLLASIFNNLHLG